MGPTVGHMFLLEVTYRIPYILSKRTDVSADHLHHKSVAEMFGEVHVPLWIGISEAFGKTNVECVL